MEYTNPHNDPGRATPDVDRQQAYAPPPPPPHPQQAYRDRRDLPLKSTVLAVVLSTIMPGLGQVYVGYYRHAFTYVIIFASVIAMLSSSAGGGLEPLLGVFIAFFYFYQLVDAGRKASLYNQVLLRGEAMDLSTEDLPEAGGSLFGGSMLIIVGLIALANTVFDISMAWLEDWWPLGLIIVGGWLVKRAQKEKASED